MYSSIEFQKEKQHTIADNWHIEDVIYATRGS
jgi:hypothetical protein